MPATDSRKSDLYIHIGERIRGRRKVLSLSQRELGRLVRIKPQQLFKYEKGMDRISAGHLLELSKALLVPINYFYEEKVDLQHHCSELVVMCTNEQGKRFTLKILDEDHIFSQMKIAENKT